MRRAGLARAHEKSRTSTRRFTGPLHYRCATWANRAGDRSRTDLSLCGAQSCHLDSPAWRCCVGSTWFLESPSARLLRSVTQHVDRVGFEPTLWRGKSPLQSDFATDPFAASTAACSPTLWNRTRTSRASAERADQLRKSGLRAPRVFGPTRGADHHHRLRLSESGMRRAHLGPSCLRFAGGRTSGVNAPGSYSGAFIAIRDLD